MGQNVKNLEELEIERKQVKKKSNILIIIAVVSIVAGIALFFKIQFLGILFIIVAIVLFIISANIQSKFKKQFKSIIVEALVKEELGTSSTYDKNGGIPLEEINSLHFTSRPDRHHLEDYITATYNGVPYEMCDCTFQERQVRYDSKGHRHVHYETYFKGRVIKIDYQRDLNIELKVVNNAPRGFSKDGLEKFETEVIEFNKRFKCYTKNTEDGFYILTPSLINKMIELEGMYNGGMGFIFKHNNLYVLINNSGDFLEVSINKPIDEKQLSRLRSEIVLAASIINEFNMDSSKYNEEIDI